MRCLRLISVVFCILLPAAVLAEKQPTVALVGGTIVNLDGGAPLKNATILVEDERISKIGSAEDVVVPEQATIINTTGAWLIPGLMNMHVHLGLKLPGKMATELADETDPALALRMAHAARKTLEVGVTTIRLSGDHRHADLALKNAIEIGQAHGPRIFSAGEPLLITGGPDTEAGKVYNDGPYELVKAARREIGAGASWVKIYITGGISTEGGDIAEALMTPEEIQAVVNAAHRFGARVTAHSGSPKATTVAVDAGVDCIEHGYFLDRAVLRKMKRHGTWLVPTIVVSQPATQPFFEKIGAPNWFLKRRDSVGKAHWQALRTAIEVGVDIALGTDQLPSEPNDGTSATVREALYYVEAGMTPLQALRSATIEPARLLGVEDQLGSLQAGKYADIVAIMGDPAVDIGALDNIALVMKGGRVYLNTLGR